MNKADIINDLCQYLETEVEGFCRKTHLDTSFSRLGLDSMGHVQLSAILEKHTGQELDPTLGFDYPTINSLIDHLFSTTKEEPANAL